MVAPDTSLIATASQELLELLWFWRPGSTRWEIPEIAGADMFAKAGRLWVRAHLLQLHAGIVDTFELQISQPPYNLLVLTDPTAPVEPKRSSIVQAMSTPTHCKSLFVHRLLQLCPSPDALLGKGTHVLRAWSKGSVISVDWAARSHAQHRADMKSSRRARSATVSSNRVLWQNVGSFFRLEPARSIRDLRFIVGETPTATCKRSSSGATASSATRAWRQPILRIPELCSAELQVVPLPASSNDRC